MTSYIVSCIHDNMIYGIHDTLGAAQAEAQNKMDTYVATDPTTLSAQNTSTIYAVVKTRYHNRNDNGIILTQSSQYVIKCWQILEQQ